MFQKKVNVNYFEIVITIIYAINFLIRAYLKSNAVADLGGGALKQPRRAHTYGGPTLVIKKCARFLKNFTGINLIGLTLTCG